MILVSEKHSLFLTVYFCICHDSRLIVGYLDISNLASDLRYFLGGTRYPGAAISLRVVDVYGSLNNEHNLVQVISRVMYHTMLRSYSVSSHGRQQMDVMDFELLRASVTNFVGK